MPEYRLINPYVHGKFNNSFSSSTSTGAAQKAWSSISSHIVSNVPKFAFTLENTDNGSLSHFLVKEQIGGGKEVNFSIESLSVSLTPEQETKLKEFAVQQNGGKRDRYKTEGRDESSSVSDDSSTTSSDSSVEEVYDKIIKMKNKHLSLPVVAFNYIPTIYRLNSVFVPTFATPMVPYVKLELSSAFFG